MKLINKIIVSIAAPAILASAVASFVIYTIIQDNSQGEAFDTASGIYEYWYLSKVFAIVFGEIFFLILLIVGAIYLVTFLFNKFEARGGR